MKSIHIATVAVAVIAALKVTLGEEDVVQDFELLPEPQKANLIEGIELLAADPDAGPDARHSAWMADMIENGWAYGENFDEAAKMHPKLVNFEDLPESEQLKESLLHAVVRSMSTGEMADMPAVDIPQAGASAPPAAKGHTVVKYIGNRESHVDNLYGTGLEWAPGQSHPVLHAVAMKMLAHPDVYKQVGKAGTVDDKNNVPQQNQDKLPVPLPNLETMEKAELISFAQQHYGENLHPNMKEENMRKSIQSFIQSRGR